jgi:hypothetical protein
MLGHRAGHQVLRLLVPRQALSLLRPLTMEAWLLFAGLVVPAAAFTKLASP